MKRVLLVSLLFALALSVTTDLKVDWREFISRSDPLWKFDAKDENTMPVKWFDAPFHGNGNLGMLVLVEKVILPYKSDSFHISVRTYYHINVEK